MRPLGKDQKGALQALQHHQSWYGDGFGCGWNWGSVSETKRIFETLVQRGLVVKVQELHGGRERTVYRPKEGS